MTFADQIELADRAVLATLGGVEVSYQPLVGDPVNVQGLFDDRFVLVERDNDGVESVGPAVFLRLDDLPTNPDDDDPLLTIGSVVYKVRERLVDGLGGIRLLLHRTVA